MDPDDFEQFARRAQRRRRTALTVALSTLVVLVRCIEAAGKSERIKVLRFAGGLAAAMASLAVLSFALGWIGEKTRPGASGGDRDVEVLKRTG